jgi:hypothetical protein
MIAKKFGATYDHQEFQREIQTTIIVREMVGQEKGNFTRSMAILYPRQIASRNFLMTFMHDHGHGHGLFILATYHNLEGRTGCQEEPESKL